MWHFTSLTYFYKWKHFTYQQYWNRQIDNKYHSCITLCTKMRTKYSNWLQMMLIQKLAKSFIFKLLQPKNKLLTRTVSLHTFYWTPLMIISFWFNTAQIIIYEQNTEKITSLSNILVQYRHIMSYVRQHKTHENCLQYTKNRHNTLDTLAYV